MYQITDSILKSGVYSALTEPTREFQQRISFGEGSGANFIKHISFIKGITKIEISQEGNSDSSGLVLGSCCASSCVAEFYNPDRTYNYAGKTMFIECGVKYPFKVSYEDKTGGYYMTSNGKWVDGENVYSKVTNLIPVFEGDSFVYTGRGEWGAASVLWYDENKSFLSGEEYYSEDTRDHVTTVTIEAPDGAAWAVFQTFDYDSDVTLEVSKANDSFFYIPCGYYKVDKPETDDDWRTVSVTAYDCIDEMTGKWNTSLSMPSNAYLLLEEIATRYGLALEVESGVLAEMKSRTVTEAQALALTAYTEREVCGFLAGLFGANARINTVGKLAVKRYQNSPTDDFCILAAVQWQNGFKKTSEEEFVVNSVTSGIDDAVFTAGTGAGISFANPIITEDEISAVYDVYADVSFQPSSCEWRGNPCVECGDTVAVTDRNGNSYTVLVASQVIDLTGGLSMNTHCPGGDSEISFDTVDERTRAALNRQYTALQQAIIDVSNALNGARGGYYEVLDNDNDGNPDGWLIKQFQDGSGGLIRANYEGIGLSLDGGKTYRTAIGFEGINANCITTGKLNAERIDTSTLVVGLGNVEGLDAELKTLLQATEDAESKATNAQSTADATNLILSGITAQENGVTVVKGSTILTGSIGAAQIASGAITAEKLDAGAITAEKVNVGWQSGNCATGWISDNESYITITSDSSNNNNPKISVSTSYTSGNIDVNGLPFYASAGDVLRFGGTAYKKSTGDNGIYLKYSSKSDGTYNVVSWQNTATNANGSTVVIDKSYTVTQAGWYMITVAFNKQASGAYVTNLYCYKDVKGETIVNGKIKSTDGNTYFDLDSSIISTNNGSYRSYLSSGKLNFNYSSHNCGSINSFLYTSNYMLMVRSPDRVEIGVGSSEEASIGTGLTITEDDIIVSNSTSFIDNVVMFKPLTVGSIKAPTALGFWIGDTEIAQFGAGYCQFNTKVITENSSFSGTSHTKSGYGTIEVGVGSVNGNTTAALQLMDLNGNVKARLDVQDDNGYAAAQFYLTGTKGRSSPLAIGMNSEHGDYSSYMWLNGNQIHPTSVEAHKTDINVYSSSAINLINSSVIYSFKYKTDGDNALTKYGFIIERECPKEVIDNSGDAISLYSMCSILWKATQELSQRVNELEVTIGEKYS